jgi:hypothetical protein
MDLQGFTGGYPQAHPLFRCTTSEIERQITNLLRRRLALSELASGGWLESFMHRKPGYLHSGDGDSE